MGALLNYTKAPTETIIRDAYAIADAIVYQQEQKARQAKAVERNGSTCTTAVKLDKDVARLQTLIVERTNAWVSNYGTATVWTQYLDGHRHAAKVGA